MKTMMLVLAITVLLRPDSTGQNRISSWNDSVISKISLEIKHTDAQADTLSFGSRSDIESIITFLEHVRFSPQLVNDCGSPADDSSWRYHLIFSGIRDQVYLFNKHAFIGKSDYSIDPEVPEEFDALICTLKKD